MAAIDDPLDLIELRPLMSLSRGSPKLGVGLVDGPVATSHPDLAGANIRDLGGTGGGEHPHSDSARGHGTFVAGIFVARRESPAPAICPDCTLLVRPIFGETTSREGLPTATTLEVSQAIVEAVDAGARVVNLSAATGGPSTRVEATVQRALDHAAHRGALVVAAAGNQATLGTSAITRHHGVIPVVGYDGVGRPTGESNLGGSIGRRGLGAPGAGIVSLGIDGPPVTRAGTSFAAAFVTGVIALLWSLFPNAEASAVKMALSHGARRRSVVPPLLSAQRAYGALAAGDRHDGAGGV